MNEIDIYTNRSDSRPRSGNGRLPPSRTDLQGGDTPSRTLKRAKENMYDIIDIIERGYLKNGRYK